MISDVHPKPQSSLEVLNIGEWGLAFSFGKCFLLMTAWKKPHASYGRVFSGPLEDKQTAIDLVPQATRKWSLSSRTTLVL